MAQGRAVRHGIVQQCQKYRAEFGIMCPGKGVNRFKPLGRFGLWITGGLAQVGQGVGVAKQ